MSEGTGRNLVPSKFGITPGENLDPSPVTKPDKFGQVYDNQKDATAGDVPSAAQSNQAHLKSDVDSSRRSLHHTLGTQRNQASPGNHIHDGTTSPKLGPLEMDPANPGKTRPALTCDATGAGIRAFLHNFINFRDV